MWISLHFCLVCRHWTTPPDGISVSSLRPNSPSRCIKLIQPFPDYEGCQAKEDSPIFAEAKYPSKVITKARARNLTRQIAYFLRHQYGVGEGGPEKDIVVTISTGQSALGCIFYAVLAADGIYSAASPSSTASDLTRQVQDGPSSVVICSEDLKDVALSAAHNSGIPSKNVLVLSSYPDIQLRSADGTVECDFKGSLDWRRITDPRELEYSKACILYSSGTTGLPKGRPSRQMKYFCNTLPWY